MWPIAARELVAELMAQLAALLQLIDELRLASGTSRECR